MAEGQFGRFELQEKLGMGTVGTIYRAVDPKTNEVAAVKVLLPIMSQEPQVVARFEREMHILERLNHPNIVKYFGGGKEKEQLYFAMELVEGATLKQVLTARERLRWKEVIPIGIQVCSALQHAHNHGIIHRDLKPANLFLSEDGNVKLGDFGIARDTTSADLTATGLTVGTYLYMSPEQIKGERSISPKTDLYALGCLMFQMLTGQPPFQGQNFPEIFEQHLKAKAPDVRHYAPDCPAPLADLVKSLMEKDPNARPFNARAVQGMLTEMAADLGLEETPAAGQVTIAEMIERFRAPYETPRDVSWVSLACMAAVVLGIVLIAWRCSS